MTTEEVKNLLKQKRTSCDVYKIATKAYHVLGDISRDKEDICNIQEEIEDYYIGAWVTGFGFIDVLFPKKTTRDLTKEEVEFYKIQEYAINSQPSFKLKL